MSGKKMVSRIVALVLIIFLGAGILYSSPDWVNRTDWAPYKRKLASVAQNGRNGDTDFNSSEESVDFKEVIRKETAKQSSKFLPDAVALNLDSYPNSLGKNSAAVQETEDAYWSAEHQLQPGLVPSVVHFPWCGKRWFDFKHYLSIMAAIRAIGPDEIVIHYEHEPEVDRLYYHQWMDNLKHDFPFLRLQRIRREDLSLCGNTAEERLAVIFSFLNNYGGMFIGEDTWLLKYPPSKRKANFEFALTPDAREGYVMMRAGVLKNGTSYLDLLRNLSSSGVTSSTCATVRQFYEGNHEVHCIIVSGGRYEYFNPMHIWNLDDAYGRLTRKIFYGTEEILKPEPSYYELVPNIAHMVWIGGGKVDFVFYLSILSLLYVAEVDTVYIHGDQEPSGKYWQRIKAEQPKVKFITRPEPLHIYQGEITPFYRALMSDIIRVDIMVKYGGIYTDTDAIWVKPLSHEDRGYEAVASYDWIDWSWPYPDSVNFGVSFGKKNAPFWRIFRESMRKLHNDVHGFTGVMNPYKLLERYPHLLRIYPHLSVICYQMKCHPTWVKGYHNETNNHITSNSIPNFTQDVHAFHWTHPNPPELRSEEALRNYTGRSVFAKIGKLVLSRAGLW